MKTQQSYNKRSTSLVTELSSSRQKYEKEFRFQLVTSKLCIFSELDCNE